MKWIAALMALSLASCLVVVEDPDKPRPPRTTVQPPPPPLPPVQPPPPVQISVTWDDCRTVLYREYFGFDWDTVGACEYYVTRGGVDESDMLVLAFIAAHTGTDIHELVDRWHQRDRANASALLALALQCGMTGREFYVELPDAPAHPEPYRTLYQRYWLNERLPRDEYLVALVPLHIAVHYYGWTYRDWFDRYERARQATKPAYEVFVVEYERAGRGGRNVRLQGCVAAERPWTDASVRAAILRKRQEYCDRAARACEEFRRRRDRRPDEARERAEEEARRVAEEARRRAEEARRAAERERERAEEARLRAEEEARRAAARIVVTWEDCRLVIYREFFGLDWDAVGACEHYARTMGYDDGDLLVLAFIASWVRADVHEVVYEYERSGYNLLEVALRYRMSREDFFVDLPGNIACPPPYGRAYGFHRQRARNFPLTNADLRALIELRLAVHYFGWSPADWFGLYRECCERRRPVREIFVREYQRCGSGGRNFRLQPITVLERPWGDVRRREVVLKKRDDSRRDAASAYEARRRRGQGCATRRPAPIRDEHEHHDHDGDHGDHDHDLDREREEEARRRAEEEQRRHEEARRKAEEARKKAEEARQAEEARRKADEARRKAEEARKRAEEEQRRLEEERRKAEEARKQAEEERRRLEEERKKAEAEKKPEGQRKPDGGETKEPPKTPTTPEEKLAAARQQIRDLCAAVDAYFAEKKEYPDTGAEHLAAALKKKNKKDKAFFEFAPWMLNRDREIVDPWGRKVYYKNQLARGRKAKQDWGAFNKESYDLASTGPNGDYELGKKDDIPNWGERSVLKDEEK